MTRTITVTRADFQADPGKYSRMQGDGVTVVVLGSSGAPAMKMSAGPRMHECRACGECVTLDDEAAEDAHDW